MRRAFILFLVLLVSYLSLVVYAHRALFFSQFDEAYWKDRYEQSQWKLPLSLRTIGDDGLYLYEGYRLISGGDPTSTNAEMPPLGKYLIGLSIISLNNGYLYGLITTVSLLIGTYFLALLLIKKTVPALMLTVLLATDPLITNQFALTMMDALQAGLLVLFLSLIICAGRTKRHQPALALASGVALGLFSATKLPVLTPVIMAAAIWYIHVSTRSPRLIVMLFVGGLIGYLVPYTGYFTHGHTLLDWIKIQKWTISFYRNANLAPTWGSDIVTLITGRYQNIFSHRWEIAPEWSPTWGILFFSAVAAGFTKLRDKATDAGWGVVIGILFVTLVLYAVVPFWVRYLVVILPLLYITGGAIITKLPQRVGAVVYGVLLTANVISSIPILFPSPQSVINQFVYNTEHFLFADVYEDTTKHFRSTATRDGFRRFAHSIMADGEIEFINIEQKGKVITSRQSPQFVPMTFTYFTRQLGTFTVDTDVPFVKEDNRWRIPWDWSLLLPGLDDTSRLETRVSPARRGSIISSDKKPLAEDVPGVMVWVTPGRINKAKETELLTLLENVFNGKLIKVALHQRIVGNSLPDKPVAIGVIPRKPADPEVVTLAAFDGITFTPAITRITNTSDIVEIGVVQNSFYAECCTWLYSSTTYDGTSGVEKLKNNTLKGLNGGTLTLKDAQGNIVTTYINATKTDGKDVEP